MFDRLWAPQGAGTTSHLSLYPRWRTHIHLFIHLFNQYLLRAGGTGWERHWLQQRIRHFLLPHRLACHGINILSNTLQDTQYTRNQSYKSWAILLTDSSKVEDEWDLLLQIRKPTQKKLTNPWTCALSPWARWPMEDKILQVETSIALCLPPTRTS